MKLQDLKHDKSKAYIQMREKIEAWLKEHTEIEGTYTIDTNGTVSIHGDIQVGSYGLTRIGVRFGVVTGIFFCSSSTKLTSLKGAPKEVGGDFDCSYNRLTSLKGAPKEVGGSFDCSENILRTLEGGPVEVGGDFDCSLNHLKTLRGAPREVGESFDCSDNRLVSLEGAPREVGDNFICLQNKFKKEPDHSFMKIHGHFIWE